jgi:hypothetical protein
MNRISLMARVGSVCVAALLAASLAACGGSSSGSATISGTVTGLAANASVTLTDNGSDTVTVAGNGSANIAFKFANSVPSKATYNVAVSKQPTGQTCAVSYGSGVVDYSGDSISNVSVVCTSDAQINVQVAGLLANNSVTLRLTLQNDPANSYNATVSNGTSTFTSAGATVLVPLGGLYSVTVYQQPTSPSQTCVFTPTGTVTSASGGVVNSSPITIDFTCQ